MKKIVLLIYLSIFLIAGLSCSQHAPKEPAQLSYDCVYDTTKSPGCPDLSLAVLTTSNLNQIEDTYCKVLESEPNNSTAAFGCFLAKFSGMIESEPFGNILTSLDEPEIHVQEEILNAANPNALCTKLAQMEEKSYFQQFPKLPFSSYDFGNRSWKDFLKHLLLQLKNNRIPLQRLQDDIFALNDSLNEQLRLLSIAKNPADFSFVISREVCPVHAGDLTIRQLDVEGIYGLLGSLRIFANVLHSYTIGLEATRIMTRNGEINKVQFVKDANGSDGDRLKFAIAIDARKDLRPLLSDLDRYLESFKSFYDGIQDGEPSELFRGLMTHKKTAPFFRHWRNGAVDLRYAIAHGDAFVGLKESGYPNVRIKINALMKSIPNPAVIQNADPFVYDQRFGKIRTVGDFFRRLLRDKVHY